MSLTAFLSSRYAAFPSRDAIEMHQAAAFRRFRARVMPRSPFYRDMADLPLDRLPRMDKARLMENFSRVNTCGIDREAAFQVAIRAEGSRDFRPMIGNVSVGLSTGTSGQRGLFLATPRERRLWAAIMLGRFWPNLARPQRVAFFMRADNALYRSISNPLVRFGFFDLLSPFEAQVPRLAALNPTVLIAPARQLGLLAQMQAAGELALTPSRVISVAETLSPDDAQAIRSAFDRPVDQVYQATEGVLAMTCRAGNLHLNERWLRIDREVIDAETGAFCPIIHDFTRESLPILNYRLNDVLVPDPRPCPCGCASTRIARIEGREDDMLWWRSGRSRRMVSAEAIRTTIACLPQSLRDYRVIQQGEELHLWLEGAGVGAEGELSTAFEDLAKRLDCALPQLVFHNGLPDERDEKKRRRIKVLPGAASLGPPDQETPLFGLCSGKTIPVVSRSVASSASPE
ncbi:F390 synthetase-related protein [Paracoccus sp. (in: a-proteobacteria)]|uniref:F390 synthetase-related protein n=1 Tax=Paracoccus sp. TaxID=267 RepID=UPI002AFF51CB|nr:F390 synthetase-related protein [Paracoccus sp. (in: a-proteobacteria)]